MRRVTQMVSAQSGKTQNLYWLIMWRVINQPTPAWWVGASYEKVEQDAQKRLWPEMDSCPPLKPYMPRAFEKGKRRKNLMRFTSMPLSLRGSNSRVMLQGDPVGLVICDERRDWKPGAIDLLRKRLRTFSDSLEISTGTAGVRGDELHTDWLRGSQTMIHFRCPKCQHSQPFRFGRDPTVLHPDTRECGGVKWEESELTKPGGAWNYEAVRPTVYFECENPDCRAQLRQQDKLAVIQSIHEHHRNPAALRAGLYSVHYNVLCLPWVDCDWGSIAVEFLHAVDDARNGNLEPLKAFVCETLGEPWDDGLGAINLWDFLLDRKDAYEFGEEWPEEKARFLAADKQEKGGEHYWWVIRAFGLFGKSRMVAHGRASSYLELEEIRKQYNVPAKRSVIDSGFKAGEVYRFCSGSSWKPMKGDQVQYYLVRDVVTAKTYRRLWSETTVDRFWDAQAAQQRQIKLWRFADDPTKDELAGYLSGVLGEWTVPAKIGREYLRQMTGERREEVKDSKGRLSYVWKTHGDNHYFDCEKMLLVCAIASGLLKAQEKPEEKK
jgi:hypothetical protein